MAFTTVIVHFTAKPGQRDALTGALGQALQHTITKPDCFKCELVVDQDSDDKFAMVQQWRTSDAHKAYVEEIMADPKMGPAMQMMAHPPQTSYYDHHTSGGGQWGGPGHLELATKDVDATKKVLTDVFDWRFEEWMPGYHGFWAPGALFGGVRATADTEPTARAIPYLVVDDLDARYEAVQAAGGTIKVPIQEIPNAGRFFFFQDGGGLELAVWESAAP